MLAAALACATTPVAVQAALVHVQVKERTGMEYGAGFTIGRDEECFVITPFHVVEFAAADAITVTDAQGRQAKARLVKGSEEFDAALLRIADGVAIDCPAEWTDGAGAVAAIGSAPFLVARKVDDNGRIMQTRFFASSTSRELVELAPFGPGDEVREGDSGSSLYAGDQLVGMIISVDTGSRQAVALTQSQIHGLFGADVLSGARRTALLRPFKYRQAENAYATVAASEYLTQTANMQLNAPAADGRVPASTQYVFSGAIVDISSTRVANPHYKPPQRENESDSLGTQLFRKLERRVEAEVDDALDRNTESRYLRVFNVDVQIEVHTLANDTRVVNLERRSYELPESPTAPADLEKTAVSTAVKDALALTFDKYLK
jgi:hypothetical protein